MSTATAVSAKSAYRQLLRATRVVFHSSFAKHDLPFRHTLPIY